MTSIPSGAGQPVAWRVNWINAEGRYGTPYLFRHESEAETEAGFLGDRWAGTEPLYTRPAAVAASPAGTLFVRTDEANYASKLQNLKDALAARPEVAAQPTAPSAPPAGLKVMRDQFAYWIEWHDRNQRESGIEIADDQHVMNGSFHNAPPSWPSRGVLKNWIAALDAALAAAPSGVVDAQQQCDEGAA